MQTLVFHSAGSLPGISAFSAGTCVHIGRNSTEKNRQFPFSRFYLGEADTKLHTETASEVFVPLQLKLILKVGTTRFHKDRLTSMVGKYSDHIFQTKQKMKKIYPYPYKYWILPENIFLVF